MFALPFFRCLSVLTFVPRFSDSVASSRGRGHPNCEAVTTAPTPPQHHHILLRENSAATWESLATIAREGSPSSASSPLSHTSSRTVPTLSSAASTSSSSPSLTPTLPPAAVPVPPTQPRSSLLGKANTPPANKSKKSNNHGWRRFTSLIFGAKANRDANGATTAAAKLVPRVEEVAPHSRSYYQCDLCTRYEPLCVCVWVCVLRVHLFVCE
jgi:hypothetical protein